MSAWLVEAEPAIAILFDMEISQAEDPNWVCRASDLLSPVSITALKSVSSCNWLDPSTLLMHLSGDAANIDIEMLELRMGRLSSVTSPGQFMGPTAVTVAPRKVPPSMLSARLSDSGSTITVAFDRPSSMMFGPSGGRISPCVEVFLHSVESLGIGAKCRWLTPTTMAIDLGFVANTTHGLQPSVRTSALNPATSVDCSGASSTSALFLRAGVVRAVVGSLRSSGPACVAVAFPFSPLPPVISVSAPSHVGSCDDLVLDASGTVDPSGRTPQFGWAVSPLNDQAQAAPVLGMLTGASASLPVLAVPREALVPGARLRFSVTVATVLGASATQAVDVTVGLDPVPAVLFDGPSVRTVPASIAPTVVVVASHKVCGASTGTTPSPLIYNWTLLSAVSSPVLTDPAYTLQGDWSDAALGRMARFPGHLKLPMLQVGFVYLLRVTVTTTTQPPLSNDATVSVSVTSAGLVAAIKGGDRRVATDSSFLLDATASADLDRVAGDPMRFEWTCAYSGGGACVMASGTSFSADGLLVAGSSGAILRMPGQSLLPGQYVFTVIVAKGEAGAPIPLHFRTASATAMITVAPGSGPSVSIAASRVTANPTQPRVVLAGSVDTSGRGGAALQWTSPDVSPSTLQSLLLSPSLSGTTLAIRPVLPQGVYTFSLTATVEGTSGSASVVLVINGAPRNGYVSVTPTNGIAVETKFSVTAAEWVDDFEVSACRSVA